MKCLYFLISLLAVYKYCFGQETVYLSLTAENKIIGNGPENMGIGMGHSSLNGNWAKWLERLGVNAARLFVSPIADLRTFIGTTNWGLNLDGGKVIDSKSFNSAVLKLRTPQGRDPKFQWKNPVKWQQIFDGINKVSRNIYGSDENTINVLNNLKIETLVVEHIGCDSADTSFSFSQMSNKFSSYWAERWELYKQSYAMAVWARNKGVKIIEFYNEPDLDLSTCLTSSKYVDYYLLRSLSIQNAYQDLNKADNLNITINVAASAFARKTFGGDPKSYLGDVSVSNRNVIFNNGTNTKWNNMHMYSYHTYDKAGSSVFDDLVYLKNSITAAGASYPVIITEHNSHTSSNWDTLLTTTDNNDEASRLSSQVANIIRANTTSHYVFKFSITPSSSASREVAKNGLHWGEIYSEPFDLSDSTLSGESFRLMTLAKKSQIFSITSNDTSKYRAYLGVRKGVDNYILVVNDKIDVISLDMNLSQLGLGSSSKIVVETVFEETFGEVSILSVNSNGFLNVLLPAFSTSKLTLKPNAADVSTIDSQLSCSASAGTNSQTGSCTDTFNLAGTSNTAQHETTSVTMIKFSASGLDRTKMFMLKVNVEQLTLPYDNRLLVLGLKNSLNYDASNFSWKYLSDNGILNALSSGVIDSVTKNFVNWQSSSDLTVVGHISASSNTVNKQVMIDITDYVRFMIDNGKTDLNFLLYRPFRHPSYFTSIGQIDPDDLSLGSIFRISSANSNNKPQILMV